MAGLDWEGLGLVVLNTKRRANVGVGSVGGPIGEVWTYALTRK